MTALPTVADIDRIAGVVLDVLWRSSWQAAVLAAVVVLLQLVLRERLSAHWRHALWAIVLLRLMIPVTPPSPWSLFNVAPRIAEFSPVSTPPSGVLVIAHPPGPPLASSRTPPFTWKTVLASLWLLGALWMLARIAWATLLLSLSVRRMHRVDDPKLIALLDRCRAELNVRRNVTVLAAPTIPAPALMGFFKPRLLLPPAVIECFDADELRHILLHELAHLKRHDVAINWLASILQSLHWFNPVIWLAMARLRNDRELAADELVLSLTGGDGAPPREAYGNTLVKLLQTLSTPAMRRHSAALSGTVGILERAHPMRTRITMIARFNGRNAKRWTLAAAACMLVLLGIGLTDAVRGEPPGTPTTRVATTAAAEDPKLSVEDLKSKLRQLIAERRYDESLVVIDRILAKDPKNDYALGVRPLLQDKVQLASQRRPASSQPADAQEPAQSFEDHAMAVLLARRLPEVHFDAIAASDVIDFFRDITGANIYVNWKALEAAGIDRNTPLTMRLKDVPFEQALNQMVRDLSGGDKPNVEYATEDGVLVISSTQELAAHPQVRSFDVADLLQPQDQGSAAALEKVVSAHVPDAKISAYHDRLLAQGSAGQIREVEKVLNALREKK